MFYIKIDKTTYVLKKNVKVKPQNIGLQNFVSSIADSRLVYHIFHRHMHQKLYET